MSLELSDDHVAEICRVLIDHGVQFVVIGGVAARLHDTGHATIDIDVCPATDEENLERLSVALRQLDARLRVEGEPDGIPFDPHPDSLRQVTTMTLITTNGPLDLCFQPAGFAHGYQSLTGNSVTIEVAAVEVPVASLADVVASKRTAGRPKDIVALPALELDSDRWNRDCPMYQRCTRTPVNQREPRGRAGTRIPRLQGIPLDRWSCHLYRIDLTTQRSRFKFCPRHHSKSPGTRCFLASGVSAASNSSHRERSIAA